MVRPKDSRGQPPPCACVKDTFAALPPELRPRPRKKSSLRKVTCPGCGLVYWTNRLTDLCMDCGLKKGPPLGYGDEDLQVAVDAILSAVHG